MSIFSIQLGVLSVLTRCRLITIYDCKISLDWSGTASDGTAVTGKLTIPEVSHEITLDGLSDYVVSAALKLFQGNTRSHCGSFLYIVV